MSIEEGNKLIAEFMGGTFIQSDPLYMNGNVPFYYFKDVYRSVSVLALNYHNKWDELMPVVEKIESIHDDHHGYFGVYISSNSCSIQGTNLHMAINNPEYGAVYMSDPNAILETKIKSTWYNIIQFILWYNNNQTPQK